NRTSDARREYEAVVPVALTGRAALYADIGRLSRVEGDFIRATDAFEARVQLTPDDAAAHRDLGWILLEQGRTDAALVALGIAISLNPLDAQSHASIGRIQLDAGRNADA